MIKILLPLLACIVLSLNIFAQSELNMEGVKISALEAQWPSPKSLTFLDDELDKYNFYCANEYHRSEMALEQKKGFITYLKQNNDLDYLVIELPYAYGYWINKYLETGDTVLLRTVTSKWWAYDKFRKNLEVSHDSYGFFKWLYAFNKKNDEAVKVVAIDLDEVQHAALELWSVKQFLQEGSLFEYFDASYSQLNKLVNSEKPGLGAIENWMKKFSVEFKINETKIKSALGMEYYEMQKIIAGIDDIIERYNLKEYQRRKHRESVLIRNFKREIIPTDIIYAQFGAGHLFLHNDYSYEYRNYEFLMTVIEADPNYKEQILSIHIHCAECSLGSIRTTYKPYRLKENGGPTSHPPLDGFIDRDIHWQIDSLLNHKSSYIDLREAKNDLLQLSKLYQFLVVVF